MDRFGWSLPPGVQNWMIPGNRPHEEAYERAFEELDEEKRAEMVAFLVKQFPEMPKGWAEGVIVSGAGENWEPVNDAIYDFFDGFAEDVFADVIRKGADASKDYEEFLKGEMEDFDDEPDWDSMPGGADYVD